MDPQAWAHSQPAIEIPCQKTYVELINRIRPSIFIGYTAEGLNAGLKAHCRRWAIRTEQGVGSRGQEADNRIRERP